MRYLLPQIEEIPWWTLLSTPLALVFFVALLFWVFRRDRKAQYEEAEKLPLED